MFKKEKYEVIDDLPQSQLDLTPLNLSAEQQQTLEKGRSTFLFGAFLDPLIRVGLKHIEEGSLDRESVVVALTTIARLFQASGQAYASQPHTLRGENLQRHQQNVLQGNIVLVDPAVGMNEENRLQQLERANELLSQLPPQIQAIIAELNYEAFFKPQTMASAAATRNRDELEVLLQSLGREQHAMPHLTLTNWAIGQITAGIYAQVSESNVSLRIIDTGSGPGGTVAAITDRLATVGNTKAEGLAITCVETTAGFYKQLQAFTENDQVITDLELKVRSLGATTSTAISELGTLTTIKSDALTALKAVAEMHDSSGEIIVVTGNYSWHRLDQRTKQEIMDLFSHVPNVIFLIGDFAYHGNPVAKEYFCLGANGPLNVGNRDLSQQFTDAGYTVHSLHTTRPAALDDRIAEKLAHDDLDRAVDGHLWIVSKGLLAEKVLNLHSV